MNNYQYIIASLPDIFPDFESHEFDYDAVLGEIKAHCSKDDCRLIDYLEFGSVSTNLTPHFYHLINKKKGSHFLSEYFYFDRLIREAKVAWLDGKPLEAESEDIENLNRIFAVKNLIEREKQLDLLVWEKASELVTFDIFNIDIILSFLVKARIVCRWNALDQQLGAEMFRKLVNDVRGTFSGVKYDPDKIEQTN